MIADGLLHPVRWIVSGLVVLAIYRGSIYIFSLVAAEIMSVIGPQPWLSTFGAALAVTGLGLFAELYFGLIRGRS